MSIRQAHIGAAIFLGLATFILIKGAWIPLKAKVAEVLIEHTWQQRDQVTQIPPPWPWADTRVVGKLDLVRLQRSIFVLEGADPTTLAFSAGLQHSSAWPKTEGPAIIAGHRDTHFSVLEEVSMKDIISLTSPAGKVQHFEVEEIVVIDSEEQELELAQQEPQLVLITCYPFNAVAAGGALRYVIKASPIATAYQEI